MTDLVLGIDLGSTSVKAAVLDRAGNCLSHFAEAYPTARPSADRAEQDPADWMRLVGSALERFATEGFGGRIGRGADGADPHVAAEPVPLLKPVDFQLKGFS